jgi:hypothetical protein
MNGPVKRRCIVTLASVDIDPLFEKSADSLDVARFDRLDESQIAVGGERDCERDDDQKATGDGLPASDLGPLPLYLVPLPLYLVPLPRPLPFAV